MVSIFSKRLKEVRDRKCLTQEDIANAIKWNISASYVNVL